MARDEGERDRPVFYVNSAFFVGMFAEHVSGRIDVTVRPSGPTVGSTAANGRAPRHNGTFPGWDRLAEQVEELHVQATTTDGPDPTGSDVDGPDSPTGEEAGR